jgi:hypothetical protein
MLLPSQSEGSVSIGGVAVGTAARAAARPIIIDCPPTRICCTSHGTCCSDCDIVVPASW